MERFISILIEHYAGHFPVWLAPEQVTVLPISTKYDDYTRSVYQILQSAGLRATMDLREEKIGRKIRDAEVAKTPYMLVIGEKEMSEGSVSVRRQAKGDEGTMPLDQFKEKILNEINALK
jgi:threonyl-tRNA synthetase